MPDFSFPVAKLGKIYPLRPLIGTGNVYTSNLPTIEPKLGSPEMALSIDIPEDKKHIPSGQTTGPEALPTGEFLSYTAIITIFATWYSWTFCRLVFPEYDSGLISVGADIIANGGLPYQDFHTIILPGSYLWLALLFKLFGATQLVCQTATVSTIILSGLLTLLVSRKFIKGKLVFMPASILMVMGPYICNCYSHHWDTLFLFLAFSLTLIHGLSKGLSENRLRPSYFFASGFLAGLSIICYQPQTLAFGFGLLGAATLVYFKTDSLKQSMQTSLWILSGAVSVIAAILIYLGCTNTLAPMIEATTDFVFRNYSHVNNVAYGYEKMQWVMTSANSFPWSFGTACVFGIIKCAPLVVVAGSIVYFIYGGNLRALIEKHPQVLLLIGLAFGLWFTELHRPDMKRLVFGTPLMLVTAFYFAECIKHKIPKCRFLINGAALVIVAGLVVNAQLLLSYSNNNQNKYVTNRGIVQSPSDLSILKKLNSITGSKDKIFIYPYDTGLYFLAKRRLPSIFPMLLYGYNTDEQLKQVISDLESAKVQYVIWNTALNNSTFMLTGLPSYRPFNKEEQIIESYILEKYEFEGMYGNYRLMRRKPSNPAKMGS